MEQKYKICIIIFIIFLILDFIMIKYVNNRLYNDQFNLINNGPMDMSNIYSKLIYGFITYLLMTFALYYFVIKDNKSIYIAMLLGLLIYGVYNGTNIITINSYKLKVAILDTLWGATLFGITTYLIYKIK
jgi:uncharacterized membrane protein